MIPVPNPPSNSGGGDAGRSPEFFGIINSAGVSIGATNGNGDVVVSGVITVLGDSEVRTLKTISINEIVF